MRGFKVMHKQYLILQNLCTTQVHPLSSLTPVCHQVSFKVLTSHNLCKWAYGIAAAPATVAGPKALLIVIIFLLHYPFRISLSLASISAGLRLLA